MRSLRGNAENWHEVSVSAKSFIVLFYSGKAINFRRGDVTRTAASILISRRFLSLHQSIPERWKDDRPIFLNFFLLWKRADTDGGRVEEKWSLLPRTRSGRKIIFSYPRFIDAHRTRFDRIHSRRERERERATSTSTNYVPFDISYHLTWNVRFVISRADWWCARHYSRHPYVTFHYPININYYCRSLEDARGLGNGHFVIAV